MIDRNPHSSTRGSFSRTHWAWKFDDFPYPRLQEGLYYISRLYDLSGEDNCFFRSEALLEWMEWGFEYWTTLQHSTGVFDEAYPLERSLAATSFSSFYVGLAFQRMESKLSDSVREKVKRCLKRAGEWLCENDESHGVLSNHLGVALTALDVIHAIVPDPRFPKRAEHFLGRILNHQSTEGWMKEYEGADVGYGTHAFFYLAFHWKMTGCERTEKGLRAFADFLQYFVHPDGTIGGEYTSRNTEFYYPAGFEIFKDRSEPAAAIAAALCKSMAERRVCGVWAMDTFNIFPIGNNIWFAMDAAAVGSQSQSDKGNPRLPFAGAPFEKYFAECGIWVINRERYYALIGLSKGGTVSVFDKAKREQVHRFSGYWARTELGHLTSHDYRLSPEVKWGGRNDGEIGGAGEREVTIEVPWKKVKIPVFTSFLFLGFRVTTLTLGRVPRFSAALKKILVHVLIRRKKAVPVFHTRRIKVMESGVEFEDHIQFGCSVDELRRVPVMTSVHMGSSMYADPRSLTQATSRIDVPASGVVQVVASVKVDGGRRESFQERGAP